MQGQPILETRYLQPGELIQVTEEDRKMYYQFHTRQCGGPAAVPATLFPQPEVAVAVAPHMEADEPAPAPAEKEADDPIPVFKPAPKPRKKS